MTKVYGKLYEPQLPPERQVLQERQSLLESIKGTDSFWRAGEQYYVTCHCGKHVVTSDVFEADKFAMTHWIGCR